MEFTFLRHQYVAHPRKSSLYILCIFLKPTHFFLLHLIYVKMKFSNKRLQTCMLTNAQQFK